MNLMIKIYKDVFETFRSAIPLFHYCQTNCDRNVPLKTSSCFFHQSLITFINFPLNFEVTLVAQYIGSMLVQYIPNIFSLAKHWEYIGPILHQ